MDNLTEIGEKAHQALEARTQARDRALVQARQLTRHAAHAIRAIHRSEVSLAQENLAQALALVKTLKSDLENYPDLFFAGYTQDAIKEYAETQTNKAA